MKNILKRDTNILVLIVLFFSILGAYMWSTSRLFLWFFIPLTLLTFLHFAETAACDITPSDHEDSSKRMRVYSIIGVIIIISIFLHF